MAQEMARKDQEIAIKEGRVQQLQCEVEVNNEHMAQEMASKDQEIAVKDGRVQQLQHEMEVKFFISNTVITHTYILRSYVQTCN